MQTIPSFVYLIPVVMLFGVGLTPGVVATIVFALPPIVRLTNLGIRQVGKGFKEAGASLGLSRFLILTKIEMKITDWLWMKWSQIKPYQRLNNINLLNIQTHLINKVF